MSTLCRRQLAAVLLLVLAAVLQQPHPAAGGTLDEGTIMRRLRQRANEAGRVQGSNFEILNMGSRRNLNEPRYPRFCREHLNS